MPYARDLSTLKLVLEETLKTDEMLDGAADSGLSKEELAAEMEEKAEYLFEAVGVEIKEFDELERRHAQLSYLVRVQDIIRWLTVIAVGGVFVAVAAYAYYYIINNVVAAQELSARWGSSVVWLFVACVGLFIAYRVAGRGRPLPFNRTESEALLKRRDDARRLVEDRLARAIEEECREIFELRGVPSYEAVLKVERTHGLAEVPGTSRAVMTTPRRRLRALMEMMPGGSIGIAGPRGAGKTTLLWEYCSGAVVKLQGRPVLGVMTSAPVEYESRDFILYIFLSVCRATLRHFGVDPDAPPWLSQASPLARFDRKEYRLAAAFFVYSGLMLILTSFYMASGSSLTYLLGPIKAIGITPLQVFVTGLILSLPAMAVLLITLFTRMSKPDKPAPPLKNTQSSVSAGDAERYVQGAWAWVKTIKFQQSFTSGWSGALKLPIGLEGGANRAASLAENQKSLPEIVGGLREFLQDLATNFQVVVGIDELDKLDSDDQAQRFVNEIKSVFGLERCFYLVSVSESAMSNFERRGLPFRDAFDSSFDQIVRVDYMKLDAAKRLIARRVVGMSMPFRDLCYCLSGGLARDLIRACRSLVQLAPGGGGLAELSDGLIREDVQAKVNAVLTSAGKIELEPEGPAFIAALYRLEGALDERRPLLPECDGLNVSLARPPGDDREEAKLLASRRQQLAALGKELAAYVYYSETLLRFFGPDYDEQKLKAAELPGRSDSLNALARARQSLSVNPAVAKTIIDDFRKDRGLLPLAPLWEAPTAAAVEPPANGKAAASDGGDAPAPAAFAIAGAHAVTHRPVEGSREFPEKSRATIEEG